jgi:hypothetical protein
MLTAVNIPKTDSVLNKKKVFDLTMMSTAYIIWSRWQITETRARSNGGMIQTWYRRSIRRKNAPLQLCTNNYSLDPKVKPF